MNNNQNGSARIILPIIIILAAAVFYFYTNYDKNDSDNVLPKDEIVLKDRTPSRYVCVGEFCDGSGIDDDRSSRTVLQIPLVTDGGNIGCGQKIFFAPHWVPKTTAVLDATYKLLFNLKSQPEIPADGFQNVVGDYLKLHYDSVSITNGTAKLMLSGAMYGPGHCAEPALREQINQAAFYFDSVKKIEVYLNGKIFDWCTMSDADVTESRCDIKPQYWIDTK